MVMQAAPVYRCYKAIEKEISNGSVAKDKGCCGKKANVREDFRDICKEDVCKADTGEDLTDKNYYYKGQQDDDDFEKLKIKEFDLALRKFITKVNNTEIKSRIPQVDTTPLKNGTGTTAITITQKSL